MRRWQAKGSNVGILDIFGFENFRRNSFEQLCINVANENLQHYFNQFIFTWEQEEYARENINWSAIAFTDNSECIELLLGKMGLLALLDEESHFPRATDATMVAKFNANFKKYAKFYENPAGARDTFVIAHYASKVTYDSSGFLEKNRDKLASTLIQAVRCRAPNAGVLCPR